VQIRILGIKEAAGWVESVDRELLGVRVRMLKMVRSGERKLESLDLVTTGSIVAKVIEETYKKR